VETKKKDEEIMTKTIKQLEKDIIILGNIVRMLSLQSLGYIIVEDDLKNMPERFKIKK
jgi:hypothetical protein